MSDILRRNLAPISEEAWAEIDEQAVATVKPYLSARRIVDFSGPHGWTKASVNLGRLDTKGKKPKDGVEWGVRSVLPLAEFRVPFELDQWELDNIVRGAQDADLGALEEAAKKAALFEERAVYQGFSEAGVKGLLESAPYDKISLSEDVSNYAEAVGTAVQHIQLAGIAGPYALVLSADRYYKLMRTLKPGYPLYRIISNIIEGPVMWSPAVETGVLVSTRGGDYELCVGQDLSIGYNASDSKKVELFMTESFTFRVIEPAAAFAFSA